MTTMLYLGLRQSGFWGGAALEAKAKQKYVPGVRLARMHSHAGEIDQAIHWLNVAIDRRESSLNRLSVFWDWDNLRSDPRFQ